MAFRTRRRRKPRVNWLPVNALNAVEGATTDRAPGVEGELNFDSPEVVYDAFPLTFDATIDAENIQDDEVTQIKRTSLQDIVSGNEYRLRRIVGKFFCAAASDELDDPPAASACADVALGFIVSKTYDDGSPTTDFSTVNPLAASSMEDPWIWRRRWLLNPFGNVRQIDIANNGLENAALWMYPGTTAGYGSVSDGPHIDQKTARVIHRSERLFAVVAARGIFASGSITAGLEIHYLLDYRLLASLRPGSSGNRRNASR